jgi:hypothetical protein
MKPLHKMTKRGAVEHLRALYHAQPKANWDILAVGNVILHKGRGWRIAHIPPKRGFIMATNVMTGEVEKLLRSRYAVPELLVTDDVTLADLRTSHQEEIKTALAAGKSISLHVQYDYPELFTPYPDLWDEKRREKAQDTWARINEIRAFYDNQEPRWQFGKVDDLIAQAKKDMVGWETYRAECEAGVKITKPEAIPRIVASVNETIGDLKEQIEILRHLRKHIERTVTSPNGVRRNRRSANREGKTPCSI